MRRGRGGRREEQGVERREGERGGRREEGGGERGGREREEG